MKIEHKVNVNQKKQEKYPSTDKLTIALWKKVMEDDSTLADELQLLRKTVKEKYNKTKV